MTTSDEDNQATFELICALRGGYPKRCDFCRKPYTRRRWPIPEEAGEWTCNECLARWRAQGYRYLNEK